MATEAVVGFLVESAAKVVIEEVKFLGGVKDEVDELQRELRWLLSFLKDAQARKNEKRDIQVAIAEARDLAYEAEDLIEQYAFRISSKKRNLFKRMLFCFLNELKIHHSIGSSIEKLKSEISNTTRRFQSYGITSFLNRSEDNVSSSKNQVNRTYSHIANDVYIKLDNDVEMFVGHLVTETNSDINKIVSIYGMGGLGKTTLAKKVYNHHEIQGYFDYLAWISISQQWQKGEILQGILVKFFDEKAEEITKWRDEKLMRELSQTFRNKKCLVVLDDIWSTDVWEIIKEAFPLTNNGSKILLTTRNRNVALHIAPRGFHHEPRLLNNMESWELLRIKALGEEFQAANEQMTDVEELGKEMAKYCGGLPLAVIVLGGILAKKDIGEWEIVQKNVKDHIGRGDETMGEQGGVKKILALSYVDLALKFKPCFLYLSRYPEDSDIDVERLYQLWIAEGMILERDQIGDESIMDVAERYLTELQERSLVQVVIDDDMMRTSKFKCCRLHDLVRDMCLEKTKEENFFSFIPSRNGFEESSKLCSLPNKIHRLVIHLENDFTKYIPSPNRTTRNLRSLRFLLDIKDYKQPILRTIYSHIVQFEMLRSLEIIMVSSYPHGESLKKAIGSCCLRSIDSQKLSRVIGNLIHLRYLRLGGSLLGDIQFSIRNLKHLQTLDIRDINHIPKNLSNMTQLKHLYLPTLSFGTYGSDKLSFVGFKNLEILEGFDSRYCCLEALVKLTSIRRLNATLHFGDDNLDHLFILDSKTSLKLDLTISSSEEDDNKIDLTGLFGPSADYEVDFIQMRSTDLSKLLSCKKIFKLEIKISFDSWPTYEIGLASQLVDLSLDDSMLQDDPMETMGMLPCLKYLSFGRKSFMGTKMKCHSGGFLKLRNFQLWYVPNLKDLIIEEGAMPNLSILRILNCKKLEMIPDGLIFIKTLTRLNVLYMPENFIRRIQVINGQEGEDYYKIKHVPIIKVEE